MPQWRWGSYSVCLKLIINYWNITLAQPHIQQSYTILVAISPVSSVSSHSVLAKYKISQFLRDETPGPVSSYSRLMMKARWRNGLELTSRTFSPLEFCPDDPAGIILNCCRERVRVRVRMNESRVGRPVTRLYKIIAALKTYSRSERFWIINGIMMEFHVSAGLETSQERLGAKEDQAALRLNIHIGSDWGATHLSQTADPPVKVHPSI